MNIYIRSQDCDLFKYLDDEQCANLTAKTETVQLAANEFVFGMISDEDSAEAAGLQAGNSRSAECFVIVEQGELELKTTSGRSIGNIFPGEIYGEEGFMDGKSKPLCLKALQPCKLRLLAYKQVHEFVSLSADNAARTHAAINDTLCLKIIRITHRRNHA
ncbi:MAG: cyclic nucleotide-binding domain-containing protein [Candidatus Cloacimonas sp.]|nr:cyclic nucleotide-binding domain-containing protein [Candidatus Cloacimonas sp.]